MATREEEGDDDGDEESKDLALGSDAAAGIDGEADAEVAYVEQLLRDHPSDETRFDRALAREKEAARRAKVDPLVLQFHAHAAANDADSVQKALKRGMPADVPDHAGRTALHAACLHGQEDVVSVLLRAGADIDAVEGQRGDSALHYCALSGSERCAALMLAAGADVDAQNRAGQTPLMLAAQAGHASVLTLLAAESSEPDRQDRAGWTVLHYCAWQDLWQPLPALLESVGVEAWVKARDGAYAHDVARLANSVRANDALLRWTAKHTLAHAQGKLM